VNFSSDLPPLVSDSASLERILAELLNNACKYTPAGGEIALSITYDCHSPARTIDPTPIITFTMKNSAEIPAHELPHIFKKFYRVPKADPWKQGGTGLGLALVQKLVEQLQGTIQVESSKGWTTFTVQLPNLLSINPKTNAQWLVLKGARNGGIPTKPASNSQKEASLT
jgi:signal transduction histidine kinase